MILILKKIDEILLPNKCDFHFGAYIWLVYLSIFYVGLYFHHPIPYTGVYTTIGTILFLIVYFHAYNTSSKNIKWNILAILIIATCMLYLSTGANVFFVYAAAFCCRLGSTKKALLGLVAISTWIFLLIVIFDVSYYFYVPALVFSYMVGGINIYQHDIELKRKELILSQSEVRHLARISERERIARDLHDLIGHTFSVITLKAELASKLINQNIQQANNEVNQIEKISRDALKQIREVVTGYRSSDLNTELAHAKYVLESNDIHFSYDFPECVMDDKLNKELAIILKELITNVLKHSQARKVNATIKLIGDKFVLTVQDDGIGFESGSGNGFGLKGIQERVAKMLGEFNISSLPKSQHATAIEVMIPAGIES